MSENERLILLASSKADDSLTAAEQKELDELIMADVENQKYVDDILALKHLLSELDDVEAPEGLYSSVMKKIRTKKSKKKLVIRYIYTIAAAAAMFAIVIGQSRYMNPMKLQEAAPKENEISQYNINIHEEIEDDYGMGGTTAAAGADRAITYTSGTACTISSKNPGYFPTTKRVEDKLGSGENAVKGDFESMPRFDAEAYLTVDALYYLSREDFLQRLGYSADLEDIKIYYLDLYDIELKISEIGVPYKLSGEIDSALYITLVIK